ncbi:DUF3099 domain-containing protein [Nocardioides marmotae]|uniref:DUF3099 domain-containing protein n=1 Tax=Nocardioides marmotae TaxID=2663857 RepID=A0A6I3J9X8_9ACTN|nr:DUF3099 domain-containing protein [Nocardioides marmotae]MCR6030981.1 DUF3099 domain-containing protein [Gordonia jinghuaiqii]MBC9731694.1 DUF3099 domain-containing protein [Nocardioides marmotae]MTB82816.1 DUF3099 domain-containing protein [Nocardioides marmotae]MTB94618.1 DUF3099 domain-containing protein [Nocardioides marmotae]QKE01373.1 DUF3099 domain-containing protein [Nocardioides marmotae]
MARDQRRDRDDAVRITTAASSHNADIAARQRRYLLSMSIRSICFVGAVVAALAGIQWLWPFLIAGAILLPYVAVVLANVQATRKEGFALQDAAYGAPELPAAPSDPEVGHSAR